MRRDGPFQIVRLAAVRPEVLTLSELRTLERPADAGRLPGDDLESIACRLRSDRERLEALFPVVVRPEGLEISFTGRSTKPGGSNRCGSSELLYSLAFGADGSLTLQVLHPSGRLDLTPELAKQLAALISRESQ